jgi:hypothetical protein
MQYGLNEGRRSHLSYLVVLELYGSFSLSWKGERRMVLAVGLPLGLWNSRCFWLFVKIGKAKKGSKTGHFGLFWTVFGLF